jgi:hypothetical protein
VPEAHQPVSGRPVIRQCWHAWWILFATLTPAIAQKYEVTPFVGGRYGGTLEVQSEGGFHSVPDANLKGSLSFGVAAGVHFDDDLGDFCEGCAYVGFRWARQKTNLNLDGLSLSTVSPSLVGASRPSVSMDHFLVDFAREWPVANGKAIPFMTGSLGAARLGAPAGSSTKFAFALGAGVKIFPERRFGLRVQAEWLPVVMHAEVQRLICAGGCIVGLGGGLMNQFEVSIGPTFRF